MAYFRPGMIAGDDERDAVKPRFFQRRQKIFSAA